MTLPGRFPEAPTTARSVAEPETSGLTAGHGSRQPPNQTLVDCYTWLTRVDRRCRNLSKGERRETARGARRELLTDRVGFSWANQAELVHYATAYLDGLAKVGPLHGDAALAGYHPQIIRIRARLPRYADTIWPVLLVGERGTGKGHLLRAIMRFSDTVPLVVALATLSEGTADSELFGHRKGAFTGADRTHDGIILTAHRSRSAIFLDDVGECPSNIQSKLLTVLDDGVFRPVGSDRMVSVGLQSERRFRIYASSQPGSVAKLRADLLDRFNTVVVRIPPLRERGIDVLLLAARFLREAADVTKKPVKSLSGEARLVLVEHDWPGNVRELRNTILRADFEAEDQAVLDAATVRASLKAGLSVQSGQSDAPTEADTRAAPFPTLDEMIDRHIRAALDRNGGNVSAAAALLGRHRSTIHKWLQRRGEEEAGDAKGNSEC